MGVGLIRVCIEVMIVEGIGVGLGIGKWGVIRVDMRLGGVMGD